MPTYTCTYLVEDRELSVTVDGTQTLSDVMGKKAYLMIALSTGVPCVIDLAQYLLHTSKLNLALTLTAVAASLTDLQIASYTSTDIPTLDPSTDGFANRINVYDANAAVDITVAWTSINTPSVRNDIYQKDELNDLVLSSTTRSFTNALVAVNGVFHKTYLYNGELYVQGGFFNIKNVKKNLISVYDTTTVGGHTVLPITVANIDASNSNPFSGVTLSYPGSDFTNATLFLVIGGYLYALDNTYRLINTNRILIDICKMDLINQFLHNPNTLLTTANVADSVEAALLAVEEATPPTLVDDITYYLTETYSLEKPGANEVDMVSFGYQNKPSIPEEITYYLQNIYAGTVATSQIGAGFLSFSWASAAQTDAPTPADNIYYFLANYPVSNPAGQTMLVDYEWTTKYEALTSAIQSVPMTDFTNPAFVYNTLLSANSFLVVIQNPTLYRKTYQLTRTAIPAQYIHHGYDTPRGILLYNKQTAIPYLLYSESQNLNHNVSLGYAKICRDAYKTSLNPPAVPSPLYDLKSDALNYPTELVEYYSAA